MGRNVGILVGSGVGDVVGFLVGDRVGFLVGGLVGRSVGLRVKPGVGRGLSNCGGSVSTGVPGIGSGGLVSGASVGGGTGFVGLLFSSSSVVTFTVTFSDKKEGAAVFTTEPSNAGVSCLSIVSGEVGTGVEFSALKSSVGTAVFLYDKGSVVGSSVKMTLPPLFPGPGVSCR